MQQLRSRRKARLVKPAAAPLALALVLGACDKTPGLSGGHEPDGPLTTDQHGAAGPANTAVAAQSGLAGKLPPPGAGPRFVGNWAADQKSCEASPWRFTASAVHTPKDADCSFKQVTEVPGGYDIQAMCTAKEPPASETISIRFAESAKAMLIKSQSLGDIGLVFCGRDA
jgi:hypothetical protein